MDDQQRPKFENIQGDSAKNRPDLNQPGDNPFLQHSAAASASEFKQPEQRESYRIGDTIGGTYTILSAIGQGGMGQVFAVEHAMLRQKYALKVLSSDSPSSIGWRRFQNEARTIAKLDHANIIKVHNLGIHDERVPYYVMDLLDGETLSSWIRREGPLAPQAVIDLFLPLCEGLAYAHSRGVIHRDIKPTNVMLVQSSGKIVPKLVDFGLVKLVGDALSPSQQLTNTGEVFGSPLYMSPEQSVGRHINERSDIYSLGCTMFEALTGAPPFVGENVVQTILKHQNEEPPTLRHASMGLDFCPEWEAVIKRVLAKEASDRYQSMEELAGDLRAIKAGKKLSRRYCTTGDGDLFDESIASESGRMGVMSSRGGVMSSRDGVMSSRDGGMLSQAGGNKIVITSAILSIVAALSVAVAMGSFLAFKQNEAKKSEHVDALKYDGIQPEQAVRPTYDEDAQLENVSAPFVVNGGKPADGFKTFKFPKNISLGTLKVSFLDPTKKQFDKDARGEVKIPADGLITFEAERICGEHPKIFRKFLPADIQGLILYGSATDTDDELHYLDHLTELAVLSLEGTDVTPKGLKVVEEMPRLNTFSVANTKGLTGADLAKLKCLDRLSSIIFNKGKDTHPLLTALKNSPVIDNLSLDATKLSAEDVNLIVSMPNLRVLSLNCCPLKLEDLAPLTAMPKLTTLHIRGIDLPPKFIDTFQASKSLCWLELSEQKWSDADKTRMNAVFHNRFRYRNIEHVEI